MRKCRDCNQTLPESAFKPLASAPDGLSKTCLVCLARASERGKVYRKAHQDIERARRSRNHAKNLEYERAQRRQRDAEKRAWVQAQPYRCAAHHPDHTPPAGFRTCPACGWDLPLADFEDGRRVNCRACRAAKAEASRNLYRTSERVRMRRRELHEANREKRLEQMKQWRIAHPERARVSVKRWRMNHPEYRRNSKRRYKEAHPEKRREHARRWRARSSVALTDAYIRQLIARTAPLLRARDMPADLVALYREHVKVKRLLKRMRDEEHS